MTDLALRSPARPPASSRQGAARPHVEAPRRRSALLPFLAVLTIGLGLGLGATWFAVARNVAFGAVTAGPWTAWPRTGALDADPYTRASIARSGEAPLGLGEGLVFTARRDSEDKPLITRCAYRIVGRIPQARYWTLTAQTPDGILLDNPARRHAFTSAEVVRDAAGQVIVEASREARPGNWLPLGGDSRFDLVLRLYDTPVSVVGTRIDPAAVPRIERGSCS